MMSITQTQVTAVTLQEASASQTEAPSTQAAPSDPESDNAAPQPSTTVTLSVTAQALAAVTQAGLLKGGNPEVQVVKDALEGLPSQDSVKRPRTKSKLEKMLQKTTLLELLDRWAAQREVEKKGHGSNPEEVKQKLKNLEQLKDLL